MSALERRLDRLEQGRGPIDCELWCCATEADAQTLIGSMRDKPPPFVFITGQLNNDGQASWRVEGRMVSDLWKAIDRLSPDLKLREIGIAPVGPCRDLSDEQLFGVIAEGGATLVLNKDGSHRLLEPGAAL